MRPGSLLVLTYTSIALELSKSEFIVEGNVKDLLVEALKVSLKVT